MLFEVLIQFRNQKNIIFYKQPLIMSFQRENLWKYDSEFDNTLLFNSHSITVLYQPLVDFEEIKPIETDKRINFMSAFEGRGCLDSLRLLSTEPVPASRILPNEETLIFCHYEKNIVTDEKRYSVLPYYNLQTKGSKLIVGMDQPDRAIVIKNKLMIGIEKRCITLYRIQDMHFMVKDFDAIGIGNRLVLVDVQHVQYKNRDYVLIFGNQKERAEPYFRCLVYQITEEKLKFIKKVTIFQKEVYLPVIIFDHYKSGIEFQDQMFCLILGGYTDYDQQSYLFGGTQIHMHILVEQWIEYSHKLAHQIEFTRNHTISAGKAMKISTDIVDNQCWFIFSTEHQTLTKLVIDFCKGINDQFLIQSLDVTTKKINIRNPGSKKVETLHFSNNTLYLMKVPDDHVEHDKEIPYRLYWCDSQIQNVHSRPLRDFLSIFA